MSRRPAMAPAAWAAHRAIESSGRALLGAGRSLILDAPCPLRGIRPRIVGKRGGRARVTWAQDRTLVSCDGADKDRRGIEMRPLVGDDRMIGNPSLRRRDNRHSATLRD